MWRYDGAPAQEVDSRQRADAGIDKQYLKAGLLDEVHINLVPVLLGGGVHLFANLEGHRLDLECTRVVESDGVTHLRYRVVK